MTKRLIRWGVFVALAFILSVGALWLSAQADLMTQANAERIKPGMSLATVNRLLGEEGRPVGAPLPLAGGENHYVWEGVRGTIHVAFRGDLTATDPAEFKATAPQSLRARLLDWLGW